VKYFEGQAGPLYHNPKTEFKSYFITFSSSPGGEPGTRLEIMQMPTIPTSLNSVEKQFSGLIHLAFAVGSAEAVDALTARLQSAGCRLASAPRRTGDGYYESCILDPDGNRIEITI
jgi:lactoylglutathione lyase